MSFLELKNVSVTIGEKRIVDNVSFTMEEGGWLMIAGPNGAGKTSLARAITQAVPYSGEILLAGTDVRCMTPKDRAKRIGMLSQTNRVDYAFLVREIAQLGRYAHKKNMLDASDPDGEMAVRNALMVTGMMPYAERSALTLSGGETQRMFTAQLLAQEPKLMILDEPMNHLDPVYQRQLLALIREWLKTKGRAVISVMHDLTIARAYGSEALLMKGGRVISHGVSAAVFTPEILRETYDTDVYTFMRDMLSQWVL